MATHVAAPSMFVVKAIIILDSEGKRLLAKYYDEVTFFNLEKQKRFEKSLSYMTTKKYDDILLTKNVICVHRKYADVLYCVVGGEAENPLLLLSVLNCLYNSLLAVTKELNKKSLMQILGTALEIVDEICDKGIFLELDSKVVVEKRLARRENPPLTEQATYVLKSAKELKLNLLG